MQAASKTSPLTLECAVYEGRREEFLRDHLGEVVLIKGQEVLGFFPSVEEAEAAAYSRLGLDVSFLAREIQDKEMETLREYKFVNWEPAVPNG